MGRKKRSGGASAPRLIADETGMGAGSSSSATGGSYLRVQSSSGTVTLAPHAAPSAPAPTRVSQAATEPAAKSSRRDRQKAAGETAGSGWGHMRAPQLTAELKRELMIVKMRGAIDPKRFYRSADDGKQLPKYFQMGTLVSGAEDGAAHRLSKRERKGSMVQELLGDATVRKRAKQQFLKSQAEHSAGRKKIRKHSKAKQHRSKTRG